MLTVRSRHVHAVPPGTRVGLPDRLVLESLPHVRHQGGTRQGRKQQSSLLSRSRLLPTSDISCLSTGPDRDHPLHLQHPPRPPPARRDRRLGGVSPPFASMRLLIPMADPSFARSRLDRLQPARAHQQQRRVLPRLVPHPGLVGVDPPRRPRGDQRARDRPAEQDDALSFILSPLSCPVFPLLDLPYFPRSLVLSPLFFPSLDVARGMTSFASDSRPTVGACEPDGQFTAVERTTRQVRRVRWHERSKSWLTSSSKVVEVRPISRARRGRRQLGEDLERRPPTARPRSWPGQGRP